MSLNVSDEAYKRAVATLHVGKIIAYPTEAVYGLGCDPLCESAVMNILAQKNRKVAKGLILIAATVEQIKPYIDKLTPAQWKKLRASWPGPHTWLVPKSDLVPAWIHGDFDTVAVRVTAHPVAAQLCQRFGKPLVSTSANREAQPPCKDNIEVYQEFGDAIDYIVPGRVGGASRPTTITDLLTGKVIR